MPSDSDAETVLEDSPLSPCVWTHTATRAVEDQRQSLRQTTLSRDPQVSVAPPTELLLSPASQLNVLSQISELADAQSRQPAVHPEVRRPVRQRTHVWAPAMESTKRKNSLPAASPKPKAKRQKTQKQPTRSQAQRLAEDMLDWETCSEGELFALDTDAEEDQWIYEDISDSDFEV